MDQLTRRATRLPRGLPAGFHMKWAPSGPSGMSGFSLFCISNVVATSLQLLLCFDNNGTILRLSFNSLVVLLKDA